MAASKRKTAPNATANNNNNKDAVIKSSMAPNNKNPTSAKKCAPRAWLQAMRDLSPPRMRSPQSDVLDKSDSEDAEIQYRQWMMEHPSAIDKFNEIIAKAAGRRIAVFLDYDGTLSPIVKDPERAFMSDEMRAAVKDVAVLFPTSIISGRSREKVYQFVQLPELYYAGSHGMDIMGPAKSCGAAKARCPKLVDDMGNEMVLFQPASDFVSIMDEVFESMKERAKKIPGANVEHNKFCISIHFRCVKEENWLALAEQVQQVLDSYKGLRLTHGRKILEIRPSIAWNKGKALSYLLRSLGLESRNEVFPIYIGDDKTDEDAFEVVARQKHDILADEEEEEEEEDDDDEETKTTFGLQDPIGVVARRNNGASILKHNGLGILVSKAAKQTKATYSLRDPTEVQEFLVYLAKWRRSKRRLLYTLHGGIP